MDTHELPAWWGAQLSADLHRVFRTETNPNAAEHDAAPPEPATPLKEPAHG